MKRSVLLFLVFVLSVSAGFSQTVHLVQVSNFQFNPVNIPNVLVGDKIRWTWVNGNHTTTSSTVPSGAQPWDAEMSSGAMSFEYTVTNVGSYSYVCTPHAPNMAGTFTVSSPLPVNLSEFKLSISNNKPTLLWKTLSELNTDYFSVTRSVDGSNYAEIAKVAAAGNSTTEKSYSYIDNSKTNTKYIYYVLATVDKDGKKNFSKIQTFKNNISTSRLIISISPNPITTAGHLNLKFNSDQPGAINVTVINVAGRNVLNTSMNAETGINNGHLHLGKLPAGTYTLIFNLNGIKETHKIIKR